MVIIDIDKPKNCYYCHFNNLDKLCSINNGTIHSNPYNRNDYTCDKGCPIIEVNNDFISQLKKKGIL